MIKLSTYPEITQRHIGEFENASRCLSALQLAPYTLWFTGLSGAGKSTIAYALKNQFTTDGVRAIVLDGDVVRQGINRDLGFSASDRSENMRRLAELAKLMNQAGLIALVAAISPYREDRKLARDIIGPNRCHEIHVSTPLQVCESRDVKGLYFQARQGEIKNFTGITAPYEAPEHPFLDIDTSLLDIQGTLQIISAAIFRLKQQADKPDFQPNRPKPRAVSELDRT